MRSEVRRLRASWANASKVVIAPSWEIGGRSATSGRRRPIPRGSSSGQHVARLDLVGDLRDINERHRRRARVPAGSDCEVVSSSRQETQRPLRRCSRVISLRTSDATRCEAEYGDRQNRRERSGRSSLNTVNGASRLTSGIRPNSSTRAATRRLLRSSPRQTGATAQRNFIGSIASSTELTTICVDCERREFSDRGHRGSKRD